MVLSGWKTAAYRDNSTTRKLVEGMADMEGASGPLTEQDFNPQWIKIKRGSTSRQTWEVDVCKEPLTTNHERSPGEMLHEELGSLRVDSPGHDEGELESCLKKLDWGVSMKRLSWATQQKAEVNKLERRSQLGQTWEKLLLEYFENEMRAPSSAKLLLANPFTRTDGQLLFTWC